MGTVEYKYKCETQRSSGHLLLSIPSALAPTLTKTSPNVKCPVSKSNGRPLYPFLSKLLAFAIADHSLPAHVSLSVSMTPQSAGLSLPPPWDLSQ